MTKNMTHPSILETEAYGMPEPEAEKAEWRCGRCGDLHPRGYLVRCEVCDKLCCAGCLATKHERHGTDFQAIHNVCDSCLDKILESL